MLLLSRRLAFLLLLVPFATFAIAQDKKPEPGEKPAVPAKTEAKWAKDMEAFAAADKANPPKAGGIVFVGSSSIRLWDLKKSFPDLPVVNRGFGGSQVIDSVEHFDQLVKPHSPKIIVFYAGDNDIAGGKSPEQVAKDFAEFMKLVRGNVPKAHVLYVPIKPSGSRWKLIDKQKEANKLIADQFKKDELFTYLPMEPLVLNSDGVPDDELFKADRLHLNEKGYAKWNAVVKPKLDELLAKKE